MLMLRKIIVLVIALCLVSTVSYAASIQFREGDTGKEIINIQVKLKGQGYFSKKIDGNFTAETTKAVKNFQKDKKLPANGIVDEKTYLTLMGKKVVGKEEPIGDAGGKITATALKMVGVPYKWGGITTKGFDCSGLVWYVFDKNKITLPRTADVQYKKGKTVTIGNLQKGDLVFFTTYEPGASHVGIYLEKGKFIHASSSKGVMVSNLADSYWKPRYLGARRILLK